MMPNSKKYEFIILNKKFSIPFREIGTSADVKVLMLRDCPYIFEPAVENKRAKTISLFLNNSFTIKKEHTIYFIQNLENRKLASNSSCRFKNYPKTY
jgi:hypothetical protein